MTAMIVSVFLASLLGSLHCAGMCGAFVALAVSPVPGKPTPSIFHVQSAYHLGRLGTYVLLGIFAGTAGALVDLGSTLAGIQPVAASLAGAVMIWFGASMLLRLAGVHVPKMPLPGFMQRLLTAGHTRAMNLGPAARAGVIGLLTTLLPCGWLYAFAVVAAGTASPFTGGLVMVIFWAGTLPVLVTIGTGLRAGLGSLGRRLPMVTSLLVIGVGLYTLSGRAFFDAKALARTVSNEHRDAHPVAHPVAQLVAGGPAPSTVPLMPTTVPACCREDEVTP
jgi:uncharacterized protein